MIVLTELNDFITPELNCIKPIQTIPKSDTKVTVEIAQNGKYFEVGIDGELEGLAPAGITLTDCLACSGCITSAETILVSMQHDKELLRVLDERKLSKAKDDAMDGVEDGDGRKTRNNELVIVVSISSQARASLGLKWGFDRQEIWHALNHYFINILGMDHVFDIDYARDLTLLSSGKEFLSRFSAGQPMLASSCPGWVCYAEKTHPVLLPLLDTSKSPQQVMGSLVKDMFAGKMGLTPNQIYHVSIMPCYDKKLEASRQDFYNEVYEARDVDLVLSTSEVEKMLKDANLDPSILPRSIQATGDISSIGTTLLKTGGSSSGGYLDWIMRSAVKSLFGVHLSSLDIQTGKNGITIAEGRNSGFTSVSYTPDGSSEPVLRFAYVYGFRNIQNLVRKLKQKKGPVAYHFVEVMACPSGCINGGGQAKPDVLSVSTAKEWIDASDQVYSNGDGSVLDPDNQAILQLVQEWIGNDEEKERRLLHTQYHAVENLFQSSLAVKW